MIALNGILAPSGGGGGAGDVVGPASSTDNAIARYDGTTGKLLQNSGLLIDDTDRLVMTADGTSGKGIYFNTTGFPAVIGTTDHINIGPAGGTFVFTFDNNFGDIWVASTGGYNWSSTGASTGTLDTGLKRSSAGVVKVTDGSTGYGSVLASGIQTTAATAAGNKFGGFYLGPSASLGTSFIVTQNPFAGDSDCMLLLKSDGTLTISNDTNQQRTNFKMAATTVNLTGASTTATGLFPAKSYHLGVTARITTGVTSGDGGTSIDVGDGTDVDRYAAALGFTVNGTVDMSLATADPTGWLSGAGDVVFTCNAGTFSGGVVRVVAHYIDLSPPTS